MNKVSFEGIGEVVATFYAKEGVTAGSVVKMEGAMTVNAPSAGEQICGVAVNVKDGYAGVQVKGFVKVKCTDSNVTAGIVKLCADGAGGVKKANAGDPYLVVGSDEADTVIILM